MREVSNCDSIHLNAANLSVSKGASVFLMTTQTYSAPSKQKRSSTVKFVSDTPDVAEVSAYGIVKAKAKGTCKVYAIAETGVYDVSTIYVR